ncbi:MAG: bifunctional riboflavin kinase/FAD synthetase [Anaerolineae bacterium]|nr:bifunctional riboflavin kinase/FAD synthetase [Anaerolineae bacterium]
MRTYHDLPDPPFTTPSNLTIGNFDGVHLGHQALIAALIADARAAGRQAGLLTFHPHPAAVLRPDADHQYLTTIDQRLAIFEALGLDYAVVYPFTRATAATPARQFMARLRETLSLATLLVGPDFALGRNREGDVEALRGFGAVDGYTVETIAPQVLGNGEVRSGRIRGDLSKGDVESAARQLGRLYLVDGEVVDGAHRGRTIGFPTANLDIPADRLLPANGVYATWSTVAGRRRASVTNIGVRPSFDNGQRTVEAHLLDFSGDLYGQHLVLEFVAHLRPEMRFPGIDALREQIARDVAAARDLLQEDR